MVIDAGSDDTTFAMAQTFLNSVDRPSTLLRMSTGRATSLDALLLADSYIDTTFVGLLSGDDALEPGFFAEFSSALAKHPEASAFNSPLKICDENLVWQSIQHPYWTGISVLDRKLLFLGNPGTAPGSVIRWETFRQTRTLRGNTDNLIGDYPRWLYLSKLTPFVTLRRAVVRYRRHPAAMSHGRLSAEFARSLGLCAALAREEAEGVLEVLLSVFLKARWRRQLPRSLRPEFEYGVALGVSETSQGLCGS